MVKLTPEQQVITETSCARVPGAARARLPNATWLL